MERATEKFRRQHEELGRLAAGLLELVGKRPLPTDELQSTLSKIAGVLKVHAAMEDEALYPRLLEHEDPSVRALAREFVERFGAAYRGFLAFRARYTTVDQIASAPDELERETRAVVQLLGERITEENGVLYERVDRLFPTG